MLRDVSVLTHIVVSSIVGLWRTPSTPYPPADTGVLTPPFPFAGYAPGSNGTANISVDALAIHGPFQSTLHLVLQCQRTFGTAAIVALSFSVTVLTPVTVVLSPTTTLVKRNHEPFTVVAAVVGVLALPLTGPAATLVNQTVWTATPDGAAAAAAAAASLSPTDLEAALAGQANDGTVCVLVLHPEVRSTSPPQLLSQANTTATGVATFVNSRLESAAIDANYTIDVVCSIGSGADPTHCTHDHV